MHNNYENVMTLECFSFFRQKLLALMQPVEALLLKYTKTT